MNAESVVQRFLLYLLDLLGGSVLLFAGDAEDEIGVCVVALVGDQIVHIP